MKMISVKSTGALVAAFLLACALGACGPQPSETGALSEQSSASASQQSEASSETSAGTEASAAHEESSVAEAEPSNAETSEQPHADTSVQRIGAVDVGFCEVPADWTVLTDGMSALKYANDDVTQVVTLSLFDMSVVPADQIETFSVDDAAQSVLVALESEGASNISFGIDELGGYEARCVSGSYPDGVDLCAWVFHDEAGVIHYLSVEGDSASINTLKSNFKASFSLAG